MHLDTDADDTQPGDQKLPPSQRRNDLEELDQCIEALGGRLTDLEFLARRMKTGESPSSKGTRCLLTFSSENKADDVVLNL